MNTPTDTLIDEFKFEAMEHWFTSTSNTTPPPLEDPQTALPTIPVAADAVIDHQAGIAKVIHIATSDLQPNPMNVAIYGDEEVDEELVESIHRFGVLTPLHATTDHFVIDGHRRLKAAAKVGLVSIPVCLTRISSGSLVAEEQLLEFNRIRLKNNEQRVREFSAYKRIETEHARVRMLRGKDPLSESTEGSAEEAEGNARDIAAKKVNMGWAKAEHREAVVLLIDHLRAQGDSGNSKRLQGMLNTKTIGTAYGEAVRRGWINGKKRTTQPPFPTLRKMYRLVPGKNKSLLYRRVQ